MVLLVSCLGSASDDDDPTAPSGGAPSGGSSGASSAGSSSGTTASGGSNETSLAGSGGEGGDGGTPNAAGSPGASQAGAAGASPGLDPTAVIRSEGCGLAPTQATGEFVKYTIETSGTKDPDATGEPGPWAYPRDYYVWLPPDYDPSKAYPLVFQGPGCTGDGTNVYSLSSTNDTENVGVNGTVIRVGLTPPPDEINHVLAPNAGCFDDAEGDDSVEWPFYEAVINTLNGTLCYDQNRVFASGNSSGGWLANQLGCRYAGNTEGYSIRGVATNQATLRTDPAHVPTCSNAPMAGFWVNEYDNSGGPFPITPEEAVMRVVHVNGCTDETFYDQLLLEDFPIGNGMPDDICKKVVGCPAQYPLVVCAFQGYENSSHDDIFNPGFGAFLQGLAAP